MAGLYGRMIDPNFAAPGRTGVGANAGIGAPGSAGLPRQQEDDFDASKLAGLLGMLAKDQKDKEAAAAAVAGEGNAPGAAPGMVPVGNEGNFDMAPAMAGQLPNGGGFAMPPAGSGEAYQLGNVGGQGPLLSNFGAGIPAGGPQAVAEMGTMQMPAAIGGAGIPQIGGLDPSQLQGLNLPWMQGGMGFGGAG